MKTEEQKLKEALKASAQTWNKILECKLPNDFDTPDLLHHIHAIQNILYTALYIDKHGYV